LATHMKETQVSIGQVKQDILEQVWQEELAQLHAAIMARRGGEPIDGGTVLAADKAELEGRHDELFAR
jgi:hypothetical protein